MHKKTLIIKSIIIFLIVGIIGASFVVPTRNFTEYQEPENCTPTVYNIGDPKCVSDNDSHYVCDLTGLDFQSIVVEFDNNLSILGDISELQINGMVMFESNQATFSSTCLNWQTLKDDNKIFYVNDTRPIDHVKISNLGNLHFKKLLVYKDNFDQISYPIEINYMACGIALFAVLIVAALIIIVEIKTSFLERTYHCLKRNFRLIITALIAIICSLLLGLAFERIADTFVVPRLFGSNNFNIFLLLFFASFIFMCACFVYQFKKGVMKPEFAFVLIAINLGLLIIFVCPFINACWDTDTHYMNIIGMASPSGQASLSDMNVCTSNLRTLNSSSFEMSVSNLNYLNSNNDNIVYFVNKNFNIEYFPGALAAAVGQFFGLSFYMKYNAIRFINLLCYVAITYFAIRKLKSGKIILLVIALFPTNLFTAASCSYDWWVNAFSFLGMAYFIGEMQDADNTITIKNTLIMCTALFLAFIPKQIYILFMILPLFMPKNKFKSSTDRRKYILTILAFILLMFAFLMFRSFTAISSHGDIRGGASVNPSGQIVYVLTHPLQYAKTLAIFLYGYLSVAGSSMYTCNFGNLGSGIFSSFFVVLIIVAIITDKNKYDKNTSKTYLRILCIIFFLITASLVATSLYVDFTAVGAKEINGVQGRYLIPMLFPLFAIIGSSKIVNKIPKKQYYYGFYIICTLYLYINFGQVMLVRLLLP